jgi:hypothetical protein
MGLFSRFCVWPLQSIRICRTGADGESIQLQTHHALEERIVEPFLGPQLVSDPSERCHHGKEDDGAGDQLVDIESAGDEGTADMGCNSRGDDADEKQYGLDENLSGGHLRFVKRLG